MMAPPPPLRQFASAPALPSRQVTEDTPPDLLEGTMDLTVILPAGHRVNMSVHRSTPMMDLLIQVTTAHKINPGGHIIHLVSDNRLVSYKPSTPIGTLDTSVIQIVPKNRVNEEARTRRAHLVTAAHEKNIRLKVNLPRNQLAVYRVPPRTQLAQVLTMVCADRALDPHTHEIRHPVNVDEKLRGSCTLADYQLQEVSVVPQDYHVPPLSVTDLITMAAITRDPSDHKRRGLLSLFSRKAKSSTGESSLSSGSAGERSISPARSDESTDGQATPRPSSLACSTTTLTPAAPAPPARPRKRQAPAPPPQQPPHTNGKDAGGRRGEGGAAAPLSLSRRSSDSSGYHEAQRSPHTSPGGSEVSSVEATRGHLPPTTNLTSVPATSSVSLASSRGKRRAPPPPKPPPAPQVIPEEAESPVPHRTPAQAPHPTSTPIKDSHPATTTEKDPHPVTAPVKDLDTAVAQVELSEPPSEASSEVPAPARTPIEAPGPDEDSRGLPNGASHPPPRPTSPTSSESSLSSVEHHRAPAQPQLPPPPDIACPPPPTATSGKPACHAPPRPQVSLEGEDMENDWNEFLSNLGEILEGQRLATF